MNLSFTKIDPSGNITAIVSSYVPRSMQSAVAARLMEDDASIEQVGFLEKPDDPGCAVRLQMMGGEFCGNASMAAAAFMLNRVGVPSGTESELRLEVSGAPDIVTVRGQMTGFGRFEGCVSMPLPESISEAELLSGFECHTFPVVRFPGICHAIVKEGSLSYADGEASIAAWCRRLGAEALGLMFLDESKKQLTPLVYVASTDTCVWEGSCASGTSAAAAYLAEIDGEFADVSLRQPRGTLRAQAQYSGSQTVSLNLFGSAVIEGNFSADLIF